MSQEMPELNVQSKIERDEGSLGLNDVRVDELLGHMRRKGVTPEQLIKILEKEGQKMPDGKLWYEQEKIDGLRELLANYKKEEDLQNREKIAHQIAEFSDNMQ